MNEDAAATAVDVLANDTDPDGGPKTITATTNGANGTVAITGGGSGLTYAPAANFCGSDSFTYTLNGGSVGTVSVTVNCVDDPPAGVNDSATIDEDAGATAVDVLANDTDPDGGAMTITAATNGVNGTVVVTGGGSGLTYAPTANFCGSDNFTYTLNGGSSATVSVTVTCLDDPPVAVNDAVTIAEDAGAVAIDVLANDTDIDGGPKTITATTNGANGTVAITGGGTGLTYEPAANFCGSSDSFTYTLNGGSTATVTVAVTCVDDSPTAVDDTATVTEDAGATAIDVLANDTDIDGGPKTIVSTTSGSNGATVVITGGGTGLTYQPAANFCGPDSFTYTLNGGSVGTVDVTVTCVDDPPTAVNDTATVLEDGGATAIDVLANDTDPDGGPMAIGATTNGANGAVVVTGGGSGLTYAPAANFCGSDSFTYTLNGGSSATVSVTVTCVNDAPSFTAGPNQTNLANQNADGTARAYTINPWATGISPGPANESGQTVDFVIDSVNPSNLFTVQPAVSPTGVLTFTTNPATNGTATITLHIHDNGGTANGGIDSSATQSFTIQIVTPPPVAVNDSYTATGNVGINVNDTAEGVLLRGTDDTLFGATITNCGATNATGTLVSGSTCTAASASGGNVVLNVNGTFTYNPPAGFNGTDHFFYRLTNSGGTSTGDVSITVSNMIWFVNNQAAACTTLANNCGRLSNPFSTLAAFQTLNTGAAPNPQDNQTIFLSTGSGTYTNGVTLRNGQILIGQGAGASITTISGITLAPFSNPLPSTGGTRPNLTTTAAATNAITLGSGNTIRGLNIGDKTGSGIAGTNFGTLAVLEVDIIGTGQALNLNNGTANATFGTLTSSSGTNGVALTNVAGTISSSSSSLTGASGDELLISGGAGSLTYPGTITKTGTGRAVTITGKSGGTVALSGQITDTGGTGGGISLTNNGGATINLTGGVQLSTGTNPALTATGGGTVSVTSTNNTLTTTTGTALNVGNTTIGDNDLTFQSISSNGAASGIILSNTGNANGRFFLTSSGSGTCQDGSTGGCSGGVIQNSTGTGISLTSVPGGAELTRVGVTGSGTHGISGSNVAGGIRLNTSAILNNGNAVTENGLEYTNVQGITTIQSSDVIGSGDFDARIANTSGTLNLTVNDTDFNGAAIDDGLQVLVDGTATIRSNITGNRFSNNHGDGFQVGSSAAAPSAVSDTTFTGNTITGSGTTTIDGGIVYGPDGSSRGNISNNSITFTSVSAFILNSPPAGTSTATFDVTANANTIGNGTAESGSGDGDGLQVKSPSDGTSKILVTNNVIRNFDKNGMLLRASESNIPPSNTQLTATGNQISGPDPAHSETGILLQAGSLSTDALTMCADVGGNTFSGTLSPQAIGDFWLSLRFPNAVMRVPNYTGTTFANRQAYFLGRNTGFVTYVEDGSQNMQNNGNPGLCQQPTAPTLPTAP